MFLSLSFSSWLSQAVGGASPRSLTEHFSEVLLSLNRHCPALLSQWLKETLQAPGFPSAQVSSEQKLAFTQQLLRWGQPPIVVDAWGTKSLLLEGVAQILRLILFVFLQGANQQAAYEGDREGVCSALPGPAGRWILSLQTELVTHKLFPAWVRLRQSKGKKKNKHISTSLWLLPSMLRGAKNRTFHSLTLEINALKPGLKKWAFIGTSEASVLKKTKQNKNICHFLSSLKRESRRLFLIARASILCSAWQQRQ